MKKSLFIQLLLLIILSFGCAGLFKNIQLSSLAQKKRHHEIIQILQRDIDRQKKLSSFQLFLLSGAYYEIRDYEKMLSTVDMMEKQIAGGDARLFGGADLSPYPGILRGFAYLDLGEYDKAIKSASEAYALLKQIGESSNTFYHAQLIDIASILGIAHTYLNNDQEADRYLDILRNIDISDKTTMLGPEKFIAIARIHMAKKQYPQALSAIQDPKAKVSDPWLTAFYDQTFQELPRFFILTKCLYETGQIQEAKKGYDQLLKHPQIKQVGGLYWPVLLDRAKIARAEGQDETAEALLREAVDVIERQRSSIPSEAGRIGYVGDKQAVYQELITLLIDGNRPADAFEYVERAKGRALVDLLASRKNIAIHACNAGQISVTLNELAKAEKKLNVINDPDSKQDSDRIRGLVITMKKELAFHAPEFASLVSVTGTPVSEIRDRLAEDETLIEYYASDRDWFVFVLKRDGITAKKLGPLNLDKDVRDFRVALTNPASSDYMYYSRDLYRKIVDPIADQLNSTKLTIVPHGSLHYLPFAALYGEGGYLIDRYNLRVLPNASVLKFLKGYPKEGEDRILILGNPDLGDPQYNLKYAQEEALSISHIFPGAVVLLGPDAKAVYVQRNGRQFRFIHFAAHGLFDPENPLNSALLLASDQGHNGWLRAGDLYSLSLNADLVTLSACETGLSKVSKGDDVVGFTRGFLYAGARSIVSSLWKVDDLATRDLMVGFYTNLPWMHKDEALRQAQLEVKKKYPHPFFWAAFQLTGLTQ